MTIYAKLKRLELEELKRLDIEGEDAQRLKAGKTALNELARNDFICPAVIERELLGKEEICESVDKKCTACAARFLTREWTADDEKIYLKNKGAGE